MNVLLVHLNHKSYATHLTDIFQPENRGLLEPTDPHTELDNLISTELDNCLISTELDSEISTQLDNCQISTQLDKINFT